MADNESVVIVGRRWGSGNFSAVKLDRDGSPLWEWEVRNFLSGRNTHGTTESLEP